MPHRTLSFILPLFIALVGCDSDPMGGDAGPPGTDSGPGDAGGEDAGPGDAGFDAGPPVGDTSNITLFLPSGPVSFEALTEEGTGVVVTGGFGLVEGTLYFAAADQLYEFDPGSRRLLDPIPLLDAARTGTLTPDYFFSGTVGTNEFVVGVVGSDAHIWTFEPMDAGDPQFGAPGGLLQRDTMSSTPDRGYSAPALEIITFGGSVLPLGISDDGASFMAETPAPFSFTFFPVAEITTCTGAAAVVADFLTMAVPPGSASGAEPAMIIVSGDTWHEVEGLCLDDGTQLLDDAGGVIAAPRVVFGTNFDGSSDGSEEVLVVVEDAQ